MAKILNDKALEEKLKTDRPDGLVMLSPEDAAAIRATIAHLRGEPKKKAKEK
jgi:hypothetical protein